MTGQRVRTVSSTRYPDSHWSMVRVLANIHLRVIQLEGLLAALTDPDNVVDFTRTGDTLEKVEQ